MDGWNDVKLFSINPKRVKVSGTKLCSLVQAPPLAFAYGRHAVLDIEMRFPSEELLDGFWADGPVEVSMELLATNT